MINPKVMVSQPISPLPPIIYPDRDTYTAVRRITEPPMAMQVDPRSMCEEIQICGKTTANGDCVEDFECLMAIYG